MRDRIASGWTEPEQRGIRLGLGGREPEGFIRLGLGGREPEGREIDFSGHERSSGYYYGNKLPGARGRLNDLDGNPHQPADEPQPERGVRLPLRRALTRSLEREVVRRERARRLGHGAQALRAPDPLVVALVEQSGQHPADARNLAHEAESSHELDPVECEGD